MKYCTFSFLLLLVCSMLLFATSFASDKEKGDENNRTVTSPYQYPVQVDSEEWKTMDISEERAACGIPFLNPENSSASAADSGIEAFIIADIQERYPFYFDYSTENGLSVLVYQMAENDYVYSLVPDKEEPVDFRPYDSGATLTASQVKAVLSFYDLEDEEIILHYCPCLISSYYGSKHVDECVQALFDYRYAVGKNVDKMSGLEY